MASPGGVVMASPGKWYWPVTYYENFYMQFNLSYEVTLLTRHPLTPDLLRRALTHLFRKVPVLRLCFAEREGNTWFREMENEAINFEVVGSRDSDEVHGAILGERHNLASGPLWCAKLRQSCPPDHQGEVGSPPALGHASTLFLGFHHTITDGTSNMLILGCLARTIDQLMANQQVQDHDQIGTFAEARRTQDLVDAALHELRTDDRLRTAALSSVRNCPRTHSLVNKTFDVNGDVNMTRNIVEVYDAATTASLIKRCKDHGVSVNAAFHALCNIATVDMLHDAGLVQDFYTIHADFLVNARRYWTGDTDNTLGCHILPLCPIFTPTPRDASQHFWDYAKTLHQTLKDTIDPKNIMRVNAANLLLNDKPNKANEPARPHQCFSLSNMGDITRLVGGGGDNVEVCGVARVAAQHLSPNNWVFLSHTYRGRLSYSLNYCTGHVTQAMARRLISRVRHHLLNVIAGDLN